MYWIDPFHYYIEGLAVNKLADLKVQCSDSDLLKFPLPSGQTCGEYMANFFSNGATGYLASPDAIQSEQCGYCTYSSGHNFYETNMQWSASRKWRNFGILIGFFVFNIVVFISLVFLRGKGRR